MLEIRSFDSGSVKIDYFLNDNSLKLKSIIDINYMNNNVLKNVKLDITIDIKIDKNEPFKDDFWLSLVAISIDQTKRDIYDLSGYNKFLVFIIRAFKMFLESGSYALVSDKDDFENKIYDENLNLIVVFIYFILITPMERLLN